MINLATFVVDYEFLRHIKHPDIVIISDRATSQGKLEGVQFLTLKELYSHPQNPQKHYIIILHDLGSKDIVTLQQFVPDTAIRINLNPGYTSLLEKNNPEINDITRMLSLHYRVVEPVSQEDFLLQLQPRTYIRIFDTFLPEKLGNISYHNGRGQLQDFGENPNILVVTNPATCDLLSGVLHELHAHSRIGYRLMVQESFGTVAPLDLIEVSNEFTRIVIVVDHYASEEQWMYYETLFSGHPSTKNMSLHYIFPQYHLAHSILKDYSAQEVVFDPQSLVASLQEIS